MEGIAMILLLAFCVAIYFLPALIAGIRNHPQIIPLTLLNLFLGWTMLGWIGALIWSAWNFSGQERV